MDEDAQKLDKVDKCIHGIKEYFDLNNVDFATAMSAMATLIVSACVYTNQPRDQWDILIKELQEHYDTHIRG